MKTSDQTPAYRLSRLAVRHLSGWTAYVLYEQLVVYSTAGVWLNLSTLYFYACNIGLFYAHLRVLESTITRQSSPRYLAAGAGVAAVLAVTLLLKLLGEYLWIFPGMPAPPGTAQLRYVISADFFRCLSFAGLSTLYWSAIHIQDYRLAAQQAKNKSLQAERDRATAEARLSEAQNAYLQQQLNPHLLFNTLNFVYSSVLPYSPDGARCLQLLAEIMRYSTDGAGEDGRVSLAEEVQQVCNLIEINRYRFDGLLQLELSADADFTPFRIMPLALLTLTENIFKHGLVRTPGKAAVLQLSVSGDGQLIYRSSNYKKPAAGVLRRPGIGLRNLALRLAYIYPGRHRLVTEDRPETYTIELTITL
jgi:two-component system LytT family sensor kinase